MSDVGQHAKNERPSWKWSYLVALTVQAALIVIVYRILSARSFLVPPAVFWMVAVLAMLTVLLMALGMMKKNISYIWWEAMLLIFAFCGIWILSLAVLPLWAAVILAGLVTLLPYVWPMTLWHDLAFLLGTVGIGLFVAIQFPFSVLLLCSVGVVIHEYMRSDQTQMATLLSAAFKAGLPPGILLPADPSGWFKSVERTWQAGRGIVIGLLPLIILPAIALRLAHRGWYWFVGMAVLTAIVGGIWGQDKKSALRSWIFLAIAVGFYAIVGIIQL